VNSEFVQPARPIHLIAQYYRAGSVERQGEIDACLRENLQNSLISMIHLLTEEDFDYSRFPNSDKIVQTVIGERLTYERAFKYANAWPEPVIWMLSNADIYFDETLRFLPGVDFTNQIFALTRHNIMSDGRLEFMPPEYAHGSQDVWIFTTPVQLEKMFTTFFLGIPGCDHRIAYEFMCAGYIVLNPSHKIIVRHVDNASDVDIHTRTSQYVSLVNKETCGLGKAVSPPYQYFLYPTDDLFPTMHSLFTENMQLAEAKSKLEVEKAHLEAERLQLIRENHELKRVIHWRDKKINALENSLSWRVTAPLRRLAQLVSVRASHRALSQIDTINSKNIDDLSHIVTRQPLPKSVVLILDFNLGGGSNLYSRYLIAYLERAGYRIVLLEYRYGLKDFHIEVNTGEEIVEISRAEEISDFFQEIVSKFAIKHIIVNQLVSWPNTGKVLDAIRESGVSYISLIHDYFMVCPVWTLFDYQEKFCGIPDDPEVCGNCLQKIRNVDIPIEQHTSLRKIGPWRKSADEYLENANKVICFSETALNWVRKAYPSLSNLEVNEHCIPEQELLSWQLRSFSGGKRLTVAVIGGVNTAKGSKFLDKLVNTREFELLPVRIVLLGEVIPMPRFESGDESNFVFHGSYIRAELGRLLDEYDASMIMIPSLCPETFCFTASEAILLGYPVLCFDVGAQAERIHHYECGWVVKPPFIQGTISVIGEILSNPNIVAEKSMLSRNYHPPASDQHFESYIKMLD